MAKSLQAVGDLRWKESASRWVRWTGRRWAQAPYSAAPDALRQPAPLEAGPALAEAGRTRILGKAVTEELLAGSTVLQQDAYFAVLSSRRPVSHWLHAMLTVLTLGLWSTVWIVMSIARKEDRVRLDVDPRGHVWVTESPK